MVLHLYPSGEPLFVKPEIVDAVLPALPDEDANTIIIRGREYKITENNTGIIIFTDMKQKSDSFV